MICSRPRCCRRPAIRIGHRLSEDPPRPAAGFLVRISRVDSRRGPPMTDLSHHQGPAGQHARCCAFLHAPHDPRDDATTRRRDDATTSGWALHVVFGDARRTLVIVIAFATLMTRARPIRPRRTSGRAGSKAATENGRWSSQRPTNYGTDDSSEKVGAKWWARLFICLTAARYAWDSWHVGCSLLSTSANEDSTAARASDEESLRAL